MPDTKVDLLQVKQVASLSEDIGNICYDEFKKNKKLETAKIALAAFRNTLYANSILLKAEKV